MPGLLEQGLQRVGVRGVAGLRALGLGHAQLVEQHDLQLLGRPEVDLLADDAVRVLRRLLDLRGELGLERGEGVVVDGDAGGLQVGEHEQQRQLQLGEQARAAEPGQLRVERVGQLGHRGRGHDLRLGARGVGLLLAARAATAGRSPARSRRAARGAGSAARGRRGRSCAAPAAPGTRPARCRWSARAASQPRARRPCSAALTSCAAFGTDSSASHSPSAASSSGRSRAHVEVRGLRRTGRRAGRRGPPATAPPRPARSPRRRGPPTWPAARAPRARPGARRGRARRARPAPCRARARRPRPRSPRPPPAPRWSASRTGARAAPGTRARRTAGARPRGPTGGPRDRPAPRPAGRRGSAR